MGWGRKWLVDFNAGKTQLVSFDWSNNTGAIDVKMNGFDLEEITFYDVGARSLVVTNLCSKTKGYWFESGC